jgi:hypothetical protein
VKSPIAQLLGSNRAFFGRRRQIGRDEREDARQPAQQRAREPQQTECDRVGPSESHISEEHEMSGFAHAETVERDRQTREDVGDRQLTVN